MQPVQQAPKAQPGSSSWGRKINDFLSRTVSKFRFVLLGILIAAAAFLLGYFIWGEINKKNVADSTALMEGAQELFQSWEYEQDASKKDTLAKDLTGQLDRLVSRYPRQYGGQRGLFLRAELSFKNKVWDAAIKDYTTLADRFPRSYLAPISLFNAGVCSEEKSDKDAAQKLYVRVYEGWKTAVVAPRAVFNAARIDEEKSAWADAQKKYEQLDSLYGQSIWNRLARNRVIELKVQGRIK